MRKMVECTACKFFNECRFSHLRNGVDHCNFFIKVVADPQVGSKEDKPCPKCKHAKGSTGMELQWVCEHCGYREAEK
jgi:ribosomal protein L37AE/L43A